MKPTLGITIGDVAGIGPEITVKTMLMHPELRQKARLVAIGDVAALRRGAEVAGLDPDAVREVASVDAVTNAPDVVEVLQFGAPLGHVVPGKIDPDAGDGAYRFVVEACRLAKEGKIDAIITAPLNKAAMHAGGHDYPGHTELLAEQFGVRDFSMILSAGDLYVFHLTTHVALRDAIKRITPQRTTAVLNLVAGLCRALGTPDERIGVCGLNPHAGENRLFGDEDADILAPAVAEARKRGINAEGPLPADALIPQAVRGRWKMVVACYHDQGHAPFKAVFGDQGVNITIGLPVVRVSVDHGTAFDIAGRGIATEGSLVLSVERAAALAPGWAEVSRAASDISV